jgi:hypothetical protein
LGSAAFLDLLNQGFDPAQHRFRIAERFDIVAKPGIEHLSKLEELTAVISTNGPFALFEFTGALPRAKLYSNWQVSTNDAAALDELASPAFDAQNTVLVSGTSVPASPAPMTNQSVGDVKFVSYAPKHIVFSTTSSASSILLLNDRFNSGWKVSVDGKPEALLRCNFIMRGVQLTAGSHKVDFQFVQPMNTFYVSLSAIIFGFLLFGVVFCLPNHPNSDLQKLPSKRDTKQAVVVRS